MKIVYADSMGFCAGVRRAVNRLEEEIEKDAKSPPATYGPLIHNPQVVADFESRGVRVLETPGEVRKGERIIVRAHGIPESTRRQLLVRGAEIIDATCPKVSRSMELARRAEDEGFQIVFAGDKGHGETAAILGALKNPAAARVVSTARDVPALFEGVDADNMKQQKILLLAQTTFDDESFQEIAEGLRDRVDEIRVKETICPATRNRQKAVRALAGEVDGILVIGGRNSANTRRLFDIARDVGKQAWQVEGPDELPAACLRLTTLGITAGASTPDKTVQETVARLLALEEEK